MPQLAEKLKISRKTVAMRLKSLKEKSVIERVGSDRKGVVNFHEFIRAEMKKNEDVSDLAEKLIQCNPGVLLVSDEVGYGVVPIDAFDRAYREAVGRICTKLAAYSDEVTRVVCGIGTVIKHD